MDELFAEYAAAFARGERPRAAEYVERAGAEGDALAAMIDRFLRSAPRPEPTLEDSVRLASILQQEPPLLELRRRRGIKRADVIERLLESLSLRRASLPALAVAYHELESGLLDPAGVDRAVWKVLHGIFGANVRELAAWRPPPLTAGAPVYHRVATTGVESLSDMSQDQQAASDDVDRLFRAVS